MQVKTSKTPFKLALIAAVTAGAAVIGALSSSAFAASHREAPMISRMPAIDNTDVYAFNSYEPGRSGFVTLIANFIPLQDAYGGPNYFKFDPDAIYEIHIDNDGDGVEDLTFQFQFTNTIKGLTLMSGGKPIAVPLSAIRTVSNVNDANLNVRETYTLKVNRGPRRNPTSSDAVSNVANGATTFDKPSDYIGTKTIPDYAGYANKHLYEVSIPGCTTKGRVFVGQRKEGFRVNLGEVFDYLNISTPRVIGLTAHGFDNSSSVTDTKNISSIAMELPANCLTKGSDTVIGVWSTASLPQTRVPADGPLSKIVASHNYVQLSRMGMPLVNEVLIGLPDKDKFNMSEPKNDVSNNFIDYFNHVVFADIIGDVYGKDGVVPVALTSRPDMEAAFLTGVPGVNQFKTVGPKTEMIRLNTAIPATPRAQQFFLGAAGCFVKGVLTVANNPACDPAGFPNGRRPGDDVTDIELRVIMGGILAPGVTPSGYLGYTDGAVINATQFDNAFPYLKHPIPGSPNGQNGEDPNPDTP